MSMTLVNSSRLTSVDQEMIDQHMYDPPGDATRLIVDGIDHTAQWAACLDESGYSGDAVEAAMESASFDPAWAAALVAANNQWAACARENGWSQVEDVDMPADGDTSDLFVQLPEEITVAQINQLMAACPNWDPERAAIEQAWYAENPGGGNMPPDVAPPAPFIAIGGPDTLPPGTEAVANNGFRVVDEAAFAQYQAEIAAKESALNADRRAWESTHPGE
ncbi:MAG: hypothetical protein LBV30_03105 [Propionibacteriaceae bacterium]|jgi:hypothetical protein|nr:hypothetical protein [Propionibacteriaceae bacterium]